MSLALYRKYRPGRFADVVGQEHVTEPLMRALANGRVHHAYLFSGPRGCGKTSTARILARSLNCERGPTSEPCGECRSCVELAPNGPGSIDVVELDAATHGLVDDARELREKAHFAPVYSRFKVYIIDEAHQLGPGAANALLKIIEEPPPHLKFIFATTAPDKILGTIRSRTHHYPFRLIPTSVLSRNLASICEQEGVPIEPPALALAARAGAGSARDAQSILGQLIAGAGPDGVTYDLAHRLLGFTDVALLDELVEAIAAGDGATVFSAIDKVMDSGHDPRRFLTDLLERFRDLIVLTAVPDAAHEGLIEAPDEHVQRLAGQAARFGSGDLVRLAEVVDAGITAMKGATPTRLQLELVCARLLLPGADDSVAGVQARLDRIERRLALDASVGTPAEPAPARDARTIRDARPGQDAAESSAEAGPRTPPAAPRTPPPAAAGATPPVEPKVARTREPAPARGGAAVADVRRLWPEVLERLRAIKRTPWSLISQEAVVAAVEDGVLTLAFRQPNLRDTFQRRDDFQTYLRQALQDVLGTDLKVEAIVDPGAGQGSAGVSAPRRGDAPGGAPLPSTASPSPAGAQPKPAKPPARPPSDPPAREPDQDPPPARAADGPDVGGDDPDPDDPDLDDGLSQRQLLEQELGAQLVQEIEHK